jgi:predicted transcriptional regulator
MVSLTIQLDDSVADTLRQMARDLERSESDLIRDALACYANRQATIRPKGIGKYHSGRADIAELTREVFRQAVRTLELEQL